jgi:hypothetical protein
MEISSVKKPRKSTHKENKNPDPAEVLLLAVNTTVVHPHLKHGQAERKRDYRKKPRDREEGVHVPLV